jgi:hypothetical protein
MSDDLYAIDPPPGLYWCAGCQHSTPSVTCERCNRPGAACKACGRCWRCDGQVPV